MDFSDKRENCGWRGIQGSYTPTVLTREWLHWPSSRLKPGPGPGRVGVGGRPLIIKAASTGDVGGVRRCKHLTEPVLRLTHSGEQALSSETLWERAAFNHAFSSLGWGG